MNSTGTDEMTNMEFITVRLFVDGIKIEICIGILRINGSKVEQERIFTISEK